jgi:imidazolonepropionase-like amidohydrolase
LADLPEVAAAQAKRTGWAKIIADWGMDDDAIPVDVLRAAVSAVHAVGGRLAVHTQQSAGGAAAVAAGVDSVEHGMCLDPALLNDMAAGGMVLTPTLSVLQASLANAAERPDSPRKRWYVGGATAHPGLVVAAAEAGVTLLAGTDSLPHGRIIDEVRALAAAGLRPHDALAAASWTARSYLGLPGLEPEAPADAVVYASDPRLDLDQLANPLAVILRGHRVH